MYADTTLVINLHFTEACNYGCGFCYAKWDETNPRELIMSATQTDALLAELYQFFAPNNPANPLMSIMQWTKTRLNLAGGEPLLHLARLPRVIRQARELGFEVSLITNGSRLTETVLHELAPDLSWLGLSIDSIDPVTNSVIGRIDRHGRILDYHALALALRDARAKNPGLRFKLNTVVNSANQAEDFGPVIALMAPDKWKVFRVLSVVTDKLAISDEAFTGFVARHEKFSDILFAEDNHEMRESYIMVDPHGRFYQNGRDVTSRGHIYSRPILEVGAAAAFQDISFDVSRYCARYRQPTGTQMR